MKLVTHLFLLASLCGTALAQPDLTRGAGRLTFGDARLALDLDAGSGAWLALRVDGAPLVAGEAGSAPFDLGEDGRRILSDRRLPITLESAEVRDGALVTTYRCGDWRVALRWRLWPERALLARTAEVTWLGAAPTKLRGFWFQTPPAAMDAAGSYLAPGRYPPERRLGRDLAAGRGYGFGGSLAPLVAQTTPSRALVWLTDDLTPGSDHTSGYVAEQAGAIGVSQRFDAQARMKSGDTQVIGDAHLWAQACDGEQALRRLHTWMKWVGQVVPADRSPWFPDTVLYSLHPGGTIGSGFHDLGGFGPATKALDRIADLGCNAIWLLPLEDRSPYLPNDYYRFADGLGTGEQYKALVARAHSLGLKVLQDCVPHGGNNTNERAKAHPEWLLQDENGGTLDYWCFDFNSPTWREYMAGVARHYVSTYGVDGYRVDAVGGSKIANWNPQLPYARGSFAQLQGGLNMLRSLRGAVKALKPDGGLLAETQGSAYGTAADAVYDFDGCYNVFQDLRRQPADVFVARLRRWLHEQDCAEAEGLLRLRHIESHDSLRATQWYGVGGARALMALSAWIPGVPLVYQEGEEGHRDAFRRIFAIRKALPELSRGAADYLSVQAPPTVFACLRTLGAQQSVVLINFGADEIRGVATLPWTGAAPKAVRDAMTNRATTLRLAGGRLSLPVSLPPLGYTVLALGERTTWPARPAASTAKAAPVASSVDAASGFLRSVSLGDLPTVGPMDVLLSADMAKLGPPKVVTQGAVYTVERAGADGKLVLAYRRSDTGVEVSARWDGPRQPSYAALLLPIPGARRWLAHTAEGDLADDYVPRHEAGDGSGYQGGIYWRPQGTNVLYDSLLHPPDGVRTNLVAELGSRRLGIDVRTSGARCLWLDRPGQRRQLCALLAWHDPAVLGGQPGSLTVRLDNEPIADRTWADMLRALNPRAQRLTAIAGGWRFENDHYRLDLSRSGIIRRLEQLKPTPRVVIESQDLYTDHGFAADRTRYGAADDNEAGCRVWQDGDTRRLSFAGQCRGFYRFDLMRQPIEYRLDYVLSAAPTFRLTAAARPSNSASGEAAFLALQTPIPAMAGLTTRRAGAVLTEGVIPPRGRVAETAKLSAPDAVTIRSADGPLLRLDELVWTGSRPPNVFGDGRNFFLAWADGQPSGGEARWLSCSGLWTVGDQAPTHIGTAPTFPAPEPAGPLLADGSFEAANEGTVRAVVGGEVVTRGSARSAWQAPADGRLVSDVAHDGHASAQVSSQSGAYLLWHQTLAVTSFPAGSRWRLSGWVKGRDIVRGDVGWKVGVLRFAATSTKTDYAACPELLGTFDWRWVTVDLTVPEGLKSLDVQAGLNGAVGTLWVDGVTLERLAP